MSDQESQPKDVSTRVRQIIADSLCLSLNEVPLKANLIRDLGAESIDFLDIIFRLEKEFAVKIPQREIERLARAGMMPEDFEIDSMLQEGGVKRLRELLPEVPPEHFKVGMPLREIPATFTVEVFVNIVRRKLEAGEWIPTTSDSLTNNSFETSRNG